MKIENNRVNTDILLSIKRLNGQIESKMSHLSCALFDIESNLDSLQAGMLALVQETSNANALAHAVQESLITEENAEAEIKRIIMECQTLLNSMSLVPGCGPSIRWEKHRETHTNNSTKRNSSA
ncbi:hypothetical protein ACYULU_08130 [Breznakiellaceae bacterium SP9]